MISDKVLHLLEYNKILELAAGCAQSASGADYVRNVRPVVDFAEAQTFLDLTDEAVLSITENKYSPSLGFDGIEGVLQKAEISAMLTLGELLKVARHLNIARNSKSGIMGLNRPLLAEIVSNITPYKLFEDKIAKIVVSENEISDTASDKLYSIRRGIRKINDSIRNKLNEYVTSSSYGKYLQDNIVTKRGGRFVIPIKLEHKGKIAGLIHDRSASGATLFVEPMAVVEYNNELKTLLMEEEVEVERIIAELSADVAGINDILFINNRQLILLDATFARATFALKTNAFKPELGKRLYIEGGKHPLIKNAVPLDIEISHKMLIISGANTGGKTVALKTIGLFSLMSASGFFVPATQSGFPIFNAIFCDIGDEQSIESALSTFSGHMVNIKNITDNADRNSLVLLDELGAGTDPAEGAALALAVARYLLEREATSIITTHYYELKEFSLERDDIVNASMQFDPATLRPTYKLVCGLPGSSNALLIAEFLGLDNTIMEYAKQNLSEEKRAFEHTLRNAELLTAKAHQEIEKYHELNRALESRLEKLKRERDEVLRTSENLRLNAKAEARRLVRNYTDEADTLLEELKEKLKQEDERALFEARTLRGKLADVIYTEEEDAPFTDTELTSANINSLQVGDMVILRSHNLTAKVVKVDQKRKSVEVISGNLALSVDVSELAIKPNPIKKAQKPKQPTQKPIQSTQAAPPAEIKLLGQTVIEATHAVEDFLLKAAARNVKIVRVVHGVGTGALRRGLHNYFKGNPLIEDYRLGIYGEGGAGVTIVTLKD